MPGKKSNIALLSSSFDSYSETFIQAHKYYLKGRIFYYSGGELPAFLEERLMINSRRRRILHILKGHFRLNKFSLEEQALIGSFRKNKIDLIFAEYGGIARRILPVAKVLKLPLIAHFHGYDASKRAQLEQNHNYNEVFQYATFVVVVSKKMYKDFINLGCPEEKLIYNVYGPRNDFFSVRPTFQKEQFIAIGRFVDKKAPYYLVLSFLEVVKKYPHAKLIIAGDGELWNACHNLINFYNLKPNISLVGPVTAQDFQLYLSESIALVQHSITAEDGDMEGTPLSILEAGAAGLPVVSTKHAGIMDIVEDGETGFLVAEHNVLGFAEKMIYLLENKENALHMGSKAKQKIKSEFSIERHIEVLNKLIAKAKK